MKKKVKEFSWRCSEASGLGFMLPSGGSAADTEFTEKDDTSGPLLTAGRAASAHLPLAVAAPSSQSSWDSRHDQTSVTLGEQE